MLIVLALGLAPLDALEKKITWEGSRPGTWVKYSKVSRQNGKIKKKAKVKTITLKSVSDTSYVLIEKTSSWERESRRSFSKDKVYDDKWTEKEEKGFVEIDGHGYTCRLWEKTHSYITYSKEKRTIVTTEWYSSGAWYPVLKRVEKHDDGTVVTTRVLTFLAYLKVAGKSLHCYQIERVDSRKTSGTRTRWLTNQVPGQLVKSVRKRRTIFNPRILETTDMLVDFEIK